MVEALYIAATQDKEAAVETYVFNQLHAGTLTLAALQRHFQLLADAPAFPPLNVQQHPLPLYDELLTPPALRCTHKSTQSGFPSYEDSFKASQTMN